MAQDQSITLGDLLKHCRHDAGLTQEELAERAQISSRAVSDLERELHAPYKDTLHRLANAMELGERERSLLEAARRRLRRQRRTAVVHVGVMQAAPQKIRLDPLPSMEPPACLRTELPDEPTELIGRQIECTAISKLVLHARGRLVTLTGSGGIGKTRLALHVARNLADMFSDGAIFVPLAAVAEPELVVLTIAQALNVTGLVGKGGSDDLLRHLRDKHLLIVLDNFEHVVDASDVVASLLNACPRLRIIATSRIPLHLTREYLYSVSPLLVPDVSHGCDVLAHSACASVVLFTERARAVQPDFTLTNDNVSDVGEICRRLEGLPLAIELAAARLRVLPLRALADRVSDQLTFLIGGSRDAPARQQTLRNTIDWSYRLLDPDDQLLFAQLSVFVGGCSLEAAESVCGTRGSPHVLDLLQSLIENSLLSRAGGHEPRFYMLETVRQYAAEMLRIQGHETATRDQHMLYFLNLAEAAELTGPRQTAWLARLDGEFPNLRAAMDWARDHHHVDQGLRFISSLRRCWGKIASLVEGQRRADEMLALEGEVDSTVRAGAAFASGEIAFARHDWERATACFEAAITLGRRGNSAVHTGLGLTYLGVVANLNGETDRADELLADGLQVLRQLGDRRVIAFAAGMQAEVADRHGDRERARAMWEQSLEVFRAVGDTAHIAGALGCLGGVALEEGDFARARLLVLESIQLARPARNLFLLEGNVQALAEIARREGRLLETARLLGVAEMLRGHTGEMYDARLQGESPHLQEMACEEVGRKAWDQAWQEGTAMSVEQGFELATAEASELPTPDRRDNCGSRGGGWKRKISCHGDRAD